MRRGRGPGHKCSCVVGQLPQMYPHAPTPDMRHLTRPKVSVSMQSARCFSLLFSGFFWGNQDNFVTLFNLNCMQEQLLLFFLHIWLNKQYAHYRLSTPPPPGPQSPPPAPSLPHPPLPPKSNGMLKVVFSSIGGRRHPMSRFFSNACKKIQIFVETYGDVLFSPPMGQ